MNARGAARIFTHCTQLDLHPSEVAAIDLATQPSALYITWCGRAPNTKLWERVTPEDFESFAQEALQHNAAYPADTFAATAAVATATRVSSTASSRVSAVGGIDTDGGSTDGGVTNHSGERRSYPLAPAGAMAATDFDDALEPRTGAHQLPMPRPVRPPLPADMAQDTCGINDYLLEDTTPKGATGPGAGASELGSDACQWHGVPDGATESKSEQLS
ncbi:hypothetical protein JKP88DRAFT_214193 [Tribonema minus]|uniref:Uncharacterized protein n=1 Tax=Tribonema minus TaxID=303371 RepID=A0A835ZIT8_9STRA|nr:hypothetical protein JKP88DRAFT_214193 [Tribonema minus]